MNQELRKKLEIGFALLVFLFFALFFALGLAYPPRPRELPLIVDVLGLLLSGYQLITVIRKPSDSYKKPERFLNWRAIIISSGSMLAYLAASYFIGMVLSSFVIVYGCGVAYGAKKKKMLIIVSICAVVVVQLLFVTLLKVRLFPGIIFGG